MIAFLVILQLGGGTKTLVDESSSPLRVANSLSDASLSPKMFGEGWRKSDSIVVDDWNKLDSLSAMHREVIAELNLKAQLEPFGIVGVADYTLVRTEPPLNTVTVRAFLFADSDKCDEWWKKKCQYDGWQKDLKIVKSNRYQALDAINTKYPNVNKRLIKFDRLWLSAHQLGDDDKHLKAAERIIDQLIRDTSSDRNNTKD